MRSSTSRLYFFHNAKALLSRGSGPYFYLPKMESHLEARLWNDVFVAAQRELGIPQGTIKATVLIETVLAAFEMDEILHELREHSAGLNIGRWDYIFSCIKKFRSRADFCLADRAQVTMTAPFMRAYALLLVRTCHRRNTFAMGGMAAQIPIKNDRAANEAALEKVRQDKIREATDGCDGTWVAHPGLVERGASGVRPVHAGAEPDLQEARRRQGHGARASSTSSRSGRSPRRDCATTSASESSTWARGSPGNGCVPVFNLMEDAATAEISRSQIWQWIRSPKGVLADGRKVTKEMVRKLVPEELAKVRALLGDAGWGAGEYEEAARLFERIVTADDYVEFLTLPGYEWLMRRVRREHGAGLRPRRRHLAHAQAMDAGWSLAGATNSAAARSPWSGNPTSPSRPWSSATAASC